MIVIHQILNILKVIFKNIRYVYTKLGKRFTFSTNNLLLFFLSKKLEVHPKRLFFISLFSLFVSFTLVTYHQLRLAWFRVKLIRVSLSVLNVLMLVNIESVNFTLVQSLGLLLLLYSCTSYSTVSLSSSSSSVS